MDSAILTAEALKLPPYERAQMIDQLWRSLDSSEQDAIDQAWAEESARRLKEYRSGKIQAIPGKEAFKIIEAELRDI